MFGVLPLVMAAAMASASALAQDATTLVVDTAFQLKTADPARSSSRPQSRPASGLRDADHLQGGDLTKLVPLARPSSRSSAPDAKTFTFTLNPAAKFSDGSPVTVDDVIFSFNRVKNVKGSPAFLLDGVTVAKGAERGRGRPDPPRSPIRACPSSSPIRRSASSIPSVVKANQGLRRRGRRQDRRRRTFLATTSAGSER